MTTATQIAALLGNPENRVHNNDLTNIGDFDALTQALWGDDRFFEWTVELDERGYPTLIEDDLRMHFQPATAAATRTDASTLAKDRDTDRLFILVVPPVEDSSMIRQSIRPGTHILTIPTTYAQLQAQILNIRENHRALCDLHRERREVHESSESVKYVLSIARELNGERNIPKLLSLILSKAREITQADAGSIYVVEANDDDVKSGKIHFKITQNSSVPQNLTAFTIPINEQSIVGSAVINRTAISIPDLYALSEDRSKNPFGAKHDRSWDQRIGYECHSMLTLPMYDITHNVIGVIQLINRKSDPHRKLLNRDDYATVIPFDETALEYAQIVAQQAGIALENAMLTDEKENLFEGFVSASVKAIEQRDPTTSGHSHRVSKLTLGLAQIVNKVVTGPFAKNHFNDDQMKEIEYASLLHDFGKLGVREQVLVKAKKLYPWELELLHERFEVIRGRREIEVLKDYVKYLAAPQTFPPDIDRNYFESTLNRTSDELETFLDFILKANEPTVLEQGGFERLKDIANMTFKDSRHRVRPYLSSQELKALSVSRGSLTAEEFAEIKSHVEHTYEFLRKIPWGRKFANVPQIAAKHHEKLDGTGYPNAAFAMEIPVQSRMMTIADIFDALTASDRPYKRAVPVDKALDIIAMEVRAEKCDKDLFELFIESKIYQSVL